MVKVNIEELVTNCNLTREEAYRLLGKTSTQSKIIGVSTHSEGVYLTTTLPSEMAQHHKVGK